LKYTLLMILSIGIGTIATSVNAQTIEQDKEFKSIHQLESEMHQPDSVVEGVLQPETAADSLAQDETQQQRSIINISALVLIVILLIVVLAVLIVIRKIRRTR
jgi:disulfide bond formation protein DsbB